MTELEKQPVNESDWDYLIVLDACRYDYFKENYTDFFQGELEKYRSRGSATPEWLWSTFTSRYSYNYISANPYINGQGLTLGELESLSAERTATGPRTSTFRTSSTHGYRTGTTR
jgi:hypothetical protein